MGQDHATLARGLLEHDRVIRAFQTLRDDRLRRLQAAHVPVHAEVVDVALHLPRERGVLLFDRQVPVVPAPVVCGPNGPRKARTPGLARDRPPSPPGSPPVPGEPEEVEGRRTLSLEGQPFELLLESGSSGDDVRSNIVGLEAAEYFAIELSLSNVTLTLDGQGFPVLGPVSSTSSFILRRYITPFAMTDFASGDGTCLLE